MGTFATFLSNLDADSLRRGKQFEVFVKWFLQNDPEWKTQIDQVWLWEEYPDRWGIDCGVDLVFLHKNGETWAVQAKCYAQHHDITKHDVDKFLSESNRKGIDKRLLIATTDRIGANAKQVCDAQEKTVIRYLLSNFERADVEYPASIAELHSAKRKAPPQPRDHQIEAITAVSRNFQDTDRGQLIMACGTGKTFTTLWVKECLQSNSTLVLLPSLGLLAQTLHEWTLAANQSFDVLCVCSDDTVGKRGGDEAVHSVTDLAFPVTSNIADITSFLKRDCARVIFSTYQSSPLVAEAQLDGSTPSFDLVIADEAHRCAGKVGSDFSTVLDSERIRAKKRLFTSATPRTYSAKLKVAAIERGVEVVGMDDEAVFGKVLFSLPFGEAIKRGLLTDYQVVIIGVDNPTIAQWIENRELIKTDSGIENDAESLAAQIGLLKAFRDYDLQRVISFHSRVSRAESFSKDIQQVAQWVGEGHRPSGSLKSDFVSGAMPTDRRRRKLAQLKALAPYERGLLANARCLSEGVDVPTLDGVAFIDPRSSQIDIIQAVGRAIRLSPNKKIGTIVIPVFIEKWDRPTESIEASNFKPIWDVLRALKAHDEVLSSELDQSRRDIGRGNVTALGTNALGKIHFNLPLTIGQSFGSALRTRLIESVTPSWEYSFGLLQSYVALHGNCRVPVKHRLPNGYGLGSWVGTQRSDKQQLSEERRVRLEELPGWTWNPFEDDWAEGYLSLTNYAANVGDCRVPLQFRMENGYRLGLWVGMQRTGQERLPLERRERLQALPGWSWNPHDDDWEIGFRNLSEYCRENGNSNVPKLHVAPDGYPLGGWVNGQRGRCKSEERRARLQSLPDWSWDAVDALWETGFEHLSDYCAEHGDCMVPRRFIAPDGYRLNEWVNNQRAKRSTISKERITRLESMSGWSWNPHDDAWEVGFSHLLDYSTQHGDCAVSSYFVTSDGFRLGSWSVKQRSKETELSTERKARLEALPNWYWDAKAEQWDIGFTQLSNYASENGHCRVPATFVTSSGYKLGLWVANIRSRREKTSSERSAMLELLPGWSWNTRGDAWTTGFRHLSEYRKNTGNCSVPESFVTTDGYRLGAWVRKQMSRKIELEAERQRLLEAVPGWVWSKRDQFWEIGFSNLAFYCDENGDCSVPYSHTLADGYQLGVWVYTQRKMCVIPERRKRLESLPGWSW